MMVSVLLAALAAQAPAQTAPVAQAPAAADFSTAPAAAGSWSYRTGAGTSHAQFTDATAAPRLSVTCTRATRRVSIVRSGVAAPVTAMALWTSSLQRSVPARGDAAAMTLTAELAAFDGLLDAIAFSRGRFVVWAQGLAPLVLPPAPEAARVIEDCRN
ncbi:hypothetical protein [Sphingomonas sp.]|uniref:hypothetical protein n=1 Tax=Sphingomonas sp. TaxID=28214 RepID=UPI00286D6DE6|nr:hypothetical protein [Sphingomonas sp.]